MLHKRTSIPLVISTNISSPPGTELFPKYQLMPDELQHPADGAGRGAGALHPWTHPVLLSQPCRPGPAAAERWAPRFGFSPSSSCARIAPQGTAPPRIPHRDATKATSIPTFCLNYKDRHLLTETRLLFRTSSSWLQMTFTSRFGIFPKHELRLQVS